MKEMSDSKPDIFIFTKKNLHFYRFNFNYTTNQSNCHKTSTLKSTK